MGRQVGFGVIGCGHIAQAEHLPAFQSIPYANLVAVADINEALAKRAAETYGAKYWFKDYRDLLKIDEVEAVEILTPHYPIDTHPQICIDAAEAGKHVLVEKPMATTIEAALDIVEACKRQNVHLAVAYPHRYDSFIWKSKRLIEDGDLGRLLSCLSLFVGWSLRPYYFNLKTRNSKSNRNQEQKSGKIDPLLQMLLNASIHHLNIIRFFLGDPTEVQADVRRERAEILMEFPGDLVATHVYAHVSPCEGVNQIHLFGDEAYLEVHFGKPHFPYSFPSLTIRRAEKSDQAIKIDGFITPYWNPFRKEIEYFARCILEDKRTLSEGEDSLKDIKLIYSIFEAARKKKRVTVKY